MANLKIIESSLNRYVNELAKEIASQYETAGKKAMREIREQAVDNWYKSKSSSQPMKLATKYEAFTTFTKSKGTVSVYSYVVPGEYEMYRRDNDSRSRYGGAMSSIDYWIKKWSGTDNALGRPIDIHWSIGEYLLYLKWDLGITALPERAHFTGTGWVNPSFNIKEPMKETVANRLRKDWNNTVEKYKRNKK